MSVLSDSEIEEMVRTNRIAIKPFSRANLQPSAYDTRVWPKAIVDGELVQFRKTLRIQPYSFALLATREYVRLPLDIVGRPYLRSSYVRQGLFPENQGRIEAGYKGNLTLPVVNLGRDAISIGIHDRLASIEFEHLSRPASKGYSGRYQSSKGPKGYRSA